MLNFIIAHLYEIFMGFWIGSEIAEEAGKNGLAELLKKGMNIVARIWGHLFLTTITGGLYLFWLIFKAMRKRRA